MADTCSFCSRSPAEIERLVPGPGVCICTDCIALAQEVVASEREAEWGEKRRELAQEAKQALREEGALRDDI